MESGPRRDQRAGTGDHATGTYWAILARKVRWLEIAIAIALVLLLVIAPLAMKRQIERRQAA
jgi:NAD(P)H-hydrate repair Nnr-like enzyme with NAD(P)H-hydrate dehydratase domain